MELYFYPPYISSWRGRGKPKLSVAFTEIHVLISSSSLQVFPSPASECIPHLTDNPTIFCHMPQWNVKKIIQLINSNNVSITVGHCRPLIHPSGSDLVTDIRGLLEKYPTFGREKETGLLGALDT